MGKEESGGLGEKTRKGKGDCSRAAPLPLGCLPKTSVKRSCVTALVKQIESRTSPQDIGKTLLRDPSTQTIRKRTTGNGHKKHNGKEQVQHAEHQKRERNR